MEKGDQKTVLISGATRGIGWETALTLAREGYRVFAGYRSEEGKNKILTQAQGANLNLQPILLDVTVPASCQQAVRTTLDRAGRIDCLINNAGFGLAGPIEHVPLEDSLK